MMSDNKQFKVRLHGIDCPENKQDFGKAAKQFLSGYISLANNVNEALLKAGLAWHYVMHDKDPKRAEMEETARKAKKGL